jgi:hypothetical protein
MPGEIRWDYRLRYHAWCDSLDDGEYWDWVLLRIAPGTTDPDGYADIDPTDTTAPGYRTPCETCGSTESSCGYDPEGRAYIHTTPPTVDEDGDSVPDWYHDTNLWVEREYVAYLRGTPPLR